MSQTYDVVLLIEQTLTSADAAQILSLHESAEGTVHYHVLLPVEDAAGRIEASMGTLAAGEVLASPATAMSDLDLEAVRRESLERARAELAATLARLQTGKASATGQLVNEHVIDALTAKVSEADAREAIVLTRPHVVSEFFHLDWTSRARRHLGVPVLHLLEHESFDQQAGAGEGITGL